LTPPTLLERRSFPSAGSSAPKEVLDTADNFIDGTLTRRPLQGQLFAIGGPMPKDLSHEASCQAIVAISDMNRHEYHGAVNFWIDRLTLASNKAAPELQFHAGTTAGYPNSPGPARATLQETIENLGMYALSQKTDFRRAPLKFGMRDSANPMNLSRFESPDFDD
jgi:hypothetical protein